MIGAMKQSWFDSEGAPTSNWALLAVSPNYILSNFVSIGNVQYVSQTGVNTNQQNFSSIDSTGAIITGSLTSGNASVRLAGSITAVESSGNTYIVGTQILGANNYGYLAKTTSSGTVYWQKRYYDSLTVISPASSFASASLTSGGNVIVAGSFTGYGIPSQDGVLASFDPITGSTNWVSTFQASFPTYSSTGFDKLQLDSSNNIYVRNNDSSNNGVLKFNSTGALQWGRTGWNTTDSNFNTNYIEAIGTDITGNTLVGGWTSNSDGSGPLALLKLDTSGTLLYAKRYWNTAYNRIFPQSIIYDGSNNAYVSGYAYTSGSSSTYDIYILKLDTSGNILWSNLIEGVISGTSDYDVESSLTLTSNNHLIVSGQTGTIGGYVPGFMMSVPSDGTGTGTTVTVGNVSLSYVSTTFTSNTSSLTFKTTSPINTYIGVPNTVNANIAYSTQYPNYITTYY